ncbi:MAG: DNA-3-methyladenine glycosylase family protein [Anaerolineales bacterium]|jgi:3-methyladenine DNA glycosylase/8-oxoguanine DNA glycosylase
MEMILPAQPPFSYPAVVHSHGWAQLAPFILDETTDALSTILRLPDGRVVRLDFGPQPQSLLVRTPDDLSPEEQAEVRQAAAWMFGLDLDLAPFYAVARQEPGLAHCVEQARGRVLRAPTLFEDVVKTILTTNTQWGGTIRMAAGLVAAFGAPHPDQPEWRAFPTAGRLAALDEAELTAQVRLGYRAPYVLALAREVDCGERDLEALQHSDLPTDELRKELLSIKGVGGYAAANLLMLLGRYDSIPIDSWAHKMVSTHFFDGEPVTPGQIEAVFAPYGEFKGLAYWFWAWDA